MHNRRCQTLPTIPPNASRFTHCSPGFILQIRHGHIGSRRKLSAVGSKLRVFGCFESCDCNFVSTIEDKFPGLSHHIALPFPIRLESSNAKVDAETISSWKNNSREKLFPYLKQLFYCFSYGFRKRNAHAENVQGLRNPTSDIWKQFFS